MSRSPLTQLFFCIPVLFLACSSPNGMPDARDVGGDGVADNGIGDAGGPCHTDIDCTDGVFCNGAERCMPGAAGANASGCLAASPTNPCLSGQTCNEAMMRCETGCTGAPDADHDGHRSIACGGDDCDDNDANRYPGNAEVCALTMLAATDGGMPSFTRTDAVHGLDPTHDEDCDPSTYASAMTHDGDHDGDGYIDHACCNMDRSGGMHCGDDCQDLSSVDGVPASMMTTVQPTNIHPSQSEVCNGVDDNCNGMIDEGVERVFYPDMDGDRFGDATGTPVRACSPPPMYVEDNLDCDDTNPQVRPGLPDVCDGLNNDCRGGVDDEPEATSRCGLVPNANVACIAGACRIASCSANTADCDMNFVNGCETDTRSSVSNCGACGHSCGTGGICTAGVCDSVVQVAAGGSHTCARRSGGALLCWGSNRYGELGLGSTGARLVPTVASVISGTVQISPGSGYTCAVPPFAIGSLSYGDTYCWGHNDSGQLGIGNLSDDPFPTSLGAMIFVDRLIVAAGAQHTCRWYLYGGTTASLQCWGRNDLGQAGIGASPQTTPNAITGFPAGFVPTGEIHVGAVHSCDIGTNGTVACWGARLNGALGDLSLTGSTATPVLAVGVAGATQLAVGDRHTCALLAAGTVMCWGRAIHGQLGRTTALANDPTPTLVPGLTGVAQISAGGENTCALMHDGTVQCWGDGTLGGVGDGTTTTRSTPTPVSGLTGATAITTGYGFSCALRAAGGMVCWGFNDQGQVGDGTALQRNAPVSVVGL